MPTLSRQSKIKWCISILLGIVLFCIPEQGLYNYNVKIFFIITVICIALVAFELVGELAVGILLPSLYCLFNVAPAEVVFSPWLDTTMLLVAGSLFMATSLEECGLLKRVAFWIMCKVKGNYTLMLLALMCAGIALNFMTSGRGYLIIGALAFGLCVSLNALGTKVGAAIALAAMIGTCSSHTFIYSAASWAVLKRMGADYISDSDITPLTILLHQWPMLIICILTILVIAKWYKPTQPLPEITYFEENLEKMGKMSREEKWNAFMVLCIILYVFTSKIHGLSINYAFCVLPWMVYLPFINAADSNTLRKVNLSPVLFAAGCMAIGTVSASLGLGDAVAGILSVLTNGSSNPFVLIAVVFIVVFILNFLMTPIAIWSLITVPVLSLVTSFGYSPVPFAYALNSLSEAIILPYEYIPYLIIFGFSMIKMKDFIILNAFRSLMILLGFLIIIVPYWMLIGLL